MKLLSTINNKNQPDLIANVYEDGERWVAEFIDTKTKISIMKYFVDRQETLLRAQFFVAGGAI